MTQVWTVISQFIHVQMLLYCRWAQCGIEAQLRATGKRLFYEARDAAACDAVLRDFRAHLATSATAGALLLCVVGAKLSEGINFGDGLGRCVVCFGLPYPDLRDLELRERLAHIERAAARVAAGGASVSTGAAAVARGGSVPAGGARGVGGRGLQQGGELGPVGREMYTNMCMQVRVMSQLHLLQVL